MADSRFKQLMLLPTCQEVRAITLIQRIARAYLARLPSLKASIEREFRELMELYQEQLEEQKPFHEAWLLEFDLQTMRTYAVVDKWAGSGFCPCLPGTCPCNPSSLAIKDGTP